VNASISATIVFLGTISLVKTVPPSIFFQIVDESCTDRLGVQLELLDYPPYPADIVLLHVEV